MTEEDKIELERIIKLTLATNTDKNSAYRLYRTYIGQKNFCLSCPGSVRDLFNIIKKWYIKNVNN